MCLPLWLSEYLPNWITAIATFALVGLAWFQLRSIRKTGEADFIHRLSVDFFTDNSRRIVRLLDLDGLTFDPNDGDPIFKSTNDGSISAYEMDDYVLGPLESIAVLERQKLLKITMIYDVFSWYIETAWENRSVHEYVRWERRQPGQSDIYERLESLYGKCLEEGRRKGRS